MGFRISNTLARSSGLQSPTLAAAPPAGKLSLSARRFPRLSFPSLGRALTCTPCDRPPSAISPDKVRPLLDSALALPSSVSRFSLVPRPSGRPTPTGPPGSSHPPPGLARLEGPQWKRSSLARPPPGARGAGERRHRAQPRSPSSGAARPQPPPAAARRSVASLLRVRRSEVGLGRPGSREPGAPMCRRATAPPQL